MGDILLLQEAQESEIVYLLGQLTGYTLVTRGYHGKDFWRLWLLRTGDLNSIHKWQSHGNPIFVRTSLVDTLNAKAEAYTRKLTSDGCSAGATVITVNGKRVAIVNVHLALFTDEPINPKVPNNIAQWNKIQEYCEALRADHIIVGGDYNQTDIGKADLGWSQKPNFFKLIDKKWVDHGKAFQMLDPTCVNHHGQWRLDHFMSNGIKCTAFKAPVSMPISKDKENLVILKEVLELCGSDHVPIYAEFSI